MFLRIVEMFRHGRRDSVTQARDKAIRPAGLIAIREFQLRLRAQSEQHVLTAWHALFFSSQLAVSRMHSWSQPLFLGDTLA